MLIIAVVVGYLLVGLIFACILDTVSEIPDREGDIQILGAFTLAWPIPVSVIVIFGSIAGATWLMGFIAKRIVALLKRRIRK